MISSNKADKRITLNSAGQIKNYNSIDLVKFIMAILVIAIHTHPLEGCTNNFINSLYQSVVNCAVPFFFIVTGFFLGKQLNEPYSEPSSINAVKACLIKTIRLYVIWNGVYLPFAVLYYISNQTPFYKAIILYLAEFFIFGEHSQSYILWYLLSTIYTLIAVLILFKKKCSLKGLLVFGISIAVLAGSFDILAHAQASLIPQSLTTVARLLNGPFYIPLGIIFSKRRPSTAASAALFVCGFIASLFAPNYLLRPLIMICSAGLFNLVLKINLKDSPKWRMMRTSSMVMYFTHLIVRAIYTGAIHRQTQYGLDVFLVTAAVTIIIGIIYHITATKIKQKRRE